MGLFDNLKEKKKEKLLKKSIIAQKSLAEDEFRKNKINPKYIFTKKYPNLPQDNFSGIEWTEKDMSAFFLAGRILDLILHAKGQPYESFVGDLERNAGYETILSSYMRTLFELDNCRHAIYAATHYYKGENPSEKITIPTKSEIGTKYLGM